MKRAIFLGFIMALGGAIAAPSPKSTPPARTQSNSCAWVLPNEMLAMTEGCHVCRAVPGGTPIYQDVMCSWGGKANGISACSFIGENQCAAKVGHSGDVDICQIYQEGEFVHLGDKFCYWVGDDGAGHAYLAGICNGPVHDRQSSDIIPIDYRNGQLSREQCVDRGYKVVHPINHEFKLMVARRRISKR